MNRPPVPGSPATPPPGTATHVVRANVFEAEITWWLGPEALHPGERNAIPYADIAELRLSFAPTRFDARRYRCKVRLRDGRTATISSSHYVAMARFEDRSRTYEPLVRDLVARATTTNPGVRLRAGRHPLTYFLEHSFLFAAILFAVAVFEAVDPAPPSWRSWLRVGIIASFLPLLILSTIRNRPRTFSASAIPDGVLPAAR
jgi:hypothetical protein